MLCLHHVLFNAPWRSLHAALCAVATTIVTTVNPTSHLCSHQSNTILIHVGISRCMPLLDTS